MHYAESVSFRCFIYAMPLHIFFSLILRCHRFRRYDRQQSLAPDAAIFLTPLMLTRADTDARAVACLRYFTRRVF